MCHPESQAALEKALDKNRNTGFMEDEEGRKYKIHR